MNAKSHAQADAILFERSKLLIMTTLARASEPISFSELVEETNLTRGNLSSHLKKLADVRYVRIKKKFEDNKPLTTLEITDAGAESLKIHLANLEAIIKEVRKTT